MSETTDGFAIAEADLRQRGPGELFGTRQHGLPELRVANLLDDFGLLEQARQDAFAIVRKDPKLERPEHKPLLPPLRRMFGDKLSLIDAA
jgi:ATP-dependent DNA helicase RecG